VRSLGLGGGPWRYAFIAVAIVAVVADGLWFAGRPTEPTMPDLTGMPLRDALDTVSRTEDACLDAVRIGGGGEPGVGLDQRPSAGEDLTLGGPDPLGVTLTVGAGTSRADIEAAVQVASITAICGGDRAGLFESSP
jgi:beta-lactam-binding protein with PASTA domain